MKQPNIVIVISDQQRADTLGCFRIFENITPQLDRIGHEGAVFKRCYSVQPVCGPARACFQSGRYASETGNYKNGKSLPKDTDTMAKHAKAQGYQTAYIGKWHIYGDEKPLKKLVGYDVPREYRAGYDYWLASNALEFTSHAYDGYLFDNDNHKVQIQGYRADFITNKALEYLKNRENAEPFFLMVSFIEPHQQNDLGRFTGPIGEAEQYKDYQAPGDLRNAKGDWKEALPDYLAMCHNLDANVGRIREELEREGIWENTLFIYSADHGCHFKTRNGEYKRSCHEASTRVPLVIHGPEFQGMGERESTTAIFDVPATVLKACGAKIPKAYRGTPLQNLVEDERDILIQISEECAGRGLVSDKWKYCIQNDEEGLAAPGADIYYEKYLYDLTQDPYEQNNLIEDEAYGEIREELKKRLLKLIQEVEGETPMIKAPKDNPYYRQKYSFLMSLNQMMEDEKTKALIEKYMPILVDNQQVQLGANLKFTFLVQYLQKMPGMKKNIEKFREELKALNDKT